MPVFIIKDKAILFAHVPKTGGSSVERYLAGQGLTILHGDHRAAGLRCTPQHLHAVPLAQLLEPAAMHLSFLIVRHPVSRIASEYRYQMRKRNWLRDRLSFSQWLATAMARRALDPWYRDNHFRPQHEFELPGARVFRFENGVDACIAFLAGDLGTPPPPSQIREKPSPPLDFALLTRDLRLIERTYSRDFDRYGYGLSRSELLEAGLSADMVP